MVVVLVDVAPQDFWLPGPAAARIVSIRGDQAADIEWLLRMIAENCETEQVLLLSPQAAALPGAELWPGLGYGWSAVHFPEYVRQEASLTGNRFVPREYFALVATSDLKAIAGEWRGESSQTLSHLFIESALVKELLGSKVLFSDAAEMGWRFPSVHFRDIDRYFQRQEPETILRKRKDGRWQLADDVVVISLPERTDRRERVSIMMERENIAFRFADGVRVRDEEIEPFEVVEVGMQDFKMAAGFEKYLRGMVGCRRAHLGVLEQAFAANLRSLLIFEDDITFEPGWRERLDAALAELPSGWLQLYFSAHDFAPSEPCGRHLRRLAGAYQTTAILYSQEGIEAALLCLRRSRMEIDCWMGKHLHRYGNSYVVHPRISYQDGGMSDIMSYHRGITH